MYSDDTTLYFNLEDFPVQNRPMLINNELERVNTWLKLNKLTLNVEKTKSMIFHKCRIIEHTKWSMNNNTIDIVSQFSSLGVILDEHLSCMVPTGPGKVREFDMGASRAGKSPAFH